MMLEDEALIVAVGLGVTANIEIAQKTLMTNNTLAIFWAFMTVTSKGLNI